MSHQRLVAIDPKVLAYDALSARPSRWDAAVIQEDINDYAQFSKILPGTPVVEMRPSDGALVVVAGWPFVLAARSISPPLTEIICETTCDIEPNIARQVSVSDLIDEMDGPKISCQMVRFHSALESLQIKEVETIQKDWYAYLSSSTSASYCSHVDWSNEQTTAKWRWKVRVPDVDILVVWTFLERMDDIGKIRSVNGISWKAFAATECHQ